jgi:hypothetical protein
MTLAIAIVALAMALLAFALVRRQTRKLAELTDMYWQLRYDHGELKSMVAPPAPDPPPPQVSFVPLGEVKRPRS